MKVQILGRYQKNKESRELPFMLQAVQAGFPSPADDYFNEVLDINELFENDPTSSYYARVSGDSMVDVGIFEGDVLSVNKGLDPRENDIVIVSVDGEFTCKFFRKTANSIQLIPGNKRFPIMEYSNLEEVEFWGVVTGVARKLR
jgi:DNA polymerase V